MRPVPAVLAVVVSTIAVVHCSNATDVGNGSSSSGGSSGGSSGSSSGSSSSSSGSSSGSGSGSSSGSSGSSDGGSSSGSGSGGSSGGAIDGGGDGGTNTSTGSADGMGAFGPIVSAWWIGMPDSAATGVIYLFSSNVPCGTVGITGPGSGWDGKIPSGTQIIELKLAWQGGKAPTTFPATYTVTASGAMGSAPPNPDQAFASYHRGPVTGNQTESPADGMNVTLTALNASTDATGTFSLTWGTNTLSGSFDAAWCANGGEP